MSHEYVLGRRTFQVTCDLVIAELYSGKREHIYRGGIMPEQTVAGQLARLEREGSISEIGAP